MGEPSLVGATELTADPAHAGRFAARISDDWTIVRVFGGVSMYVALRAMREAVDRDDLLPLTSTAMFLAPIPAGPVTIDVETLRAGRATAQLAADLRVPGESGSALHMQAVFGSPRATELTSRMCVARRCRGRTKSPFGDTARMCTSTSTIAPSGDP